MRRKTEDLQPWIEYFGMLQTFVEKGYLEVRPDRNEAFVTQPALHALSAGDDPALQMAGAVQDTARRIRAYAGWLSQRGPSCMDRPFALHVVTEQEPHDLLYTMLLTRHRRWYAPWTRAERVEFVGYTDSMP